MNIGKRITLVREGRGMNLQDLADKAGIGRSTISEIEHGVNSPNLKTLQKLADALGMTVGELVDGKLAVDTIRDMLPDNVRDFVDKQDAVPFLKLGLLAQELRVGPEHIEQFIESFRMVSDEQKKNKK